MILVIDNYDSFTYNLVQYLGELKAEVSVVRNDRISLREIGAMSPEAIVISPGPSTPKEAGISVDVVRTFHSTLPILGVCLGHQAIGEAFGGRIIKASRIMHGKTSPILHAGEGILSGIESPFLATRYHSLVVERTSLPASLTVTAWTEDQTIMGLKHTNFPVFGVQFHPESIASQHGKKILKNFLSLLPSR